METADLRSIIDEQLIIEKAEPLGSAKPPYAPGVCALFYEGKRVYVGVARGKKGLRNRKRNYVGGDERHTIHREFLSMFPEKPDRSRHIKENVSMAWHVTETATIAEELEIQIIAALKPAWNRLV